MPHGRMQRTVDGEVLHQITFGIKNVHKATLRFVQGGERHPNVTIYSLNSGQSAVRRRRQTLQLLGVGPA